MKIKTAKVERCEECQRPYQKVKPVCDQCPVVEETDDASKLDTLNLEVELFYGDTRHTR